LKYGKGLLVIPDPFETSPAGKKYATETEERERDKQVAIVYELRVEIDQKKDRTASSR